MNNKLKPTPIFFIVGKERGLDCIQDMIQRNEDIAGALIMKEDEHELEKFSKEISLLLKKYSIPHLVTKSVKDKKYYDFIKNLHPALIVVMGWRTLLPGKIIDIPRFGVVGAHESLLPRYRGFAPVNWAIINGETKTGVSLFFINKGIDSGDIIGQETIVISKKDTAWDLYKKTSSASIELLRTFLPQLKKGIAPRKKQDEKATTYTCSRTPDDGLIDWADSTNNIHNLIRGLSYPYPGAFTYYNGDKLIISKASIPVQRRFIGRVVGRVVSIKKNVGVEVLTGDGVILVEEVAQDGKGKVNPAEIITSIKATLGK